MGEKAFDQEKMLIYFFCVCAKFKEKKLEGTTHLRKIEGILKCKFNYILHSLISKL